MLSVSFIIALRTCRSAAARISCHSDHLHTGRSRPIKALSACVSVAAVRHALCHARTAPAISRRVNIATAARSSCNAVSLEPANTSHACHARDSWKLIIRATARREEKKSAELARNLFDVDELHCNHAWLIPRCII